MEKVVLQDAKKGKPLTTALLLKVLIDVLIAKGRITKADLDTAIVAARKPKS